jgi:CubicO group peptidase (beta-lactamase class C family)
MSDAGFTEKGLARLEAGVAAHVANDEVPGLTWLVARGDEVHSASTGVVDLEEGPGTGRDTIFRIASMTKPITAVAALMLVDDGTVGLDDDVDRWLPELADRRVLRDPDGPFDDTVPAARPITVRDVLTFRLGLGMDFTKPWPQPLLTAMGELGLGAGPPAPAEPPDPDEWMRRVGTLPLLYQPGEHWLYNTGSDILGVLVARAAAQPFDDFLRARIFEPLGMADTGFVVPAEALDRLGTHYAADPMSGERNVYDEAKGQWSSRPAFPSGAGGLVSTVDDYLRFGRMLLAGGTHDGTRLLSAAMVEAMTTDQLTDAQRAASGPDPAGAAGWGFGVSMPKADSPIRGAGAYGWDGGLGSTWANDPRAGLTGILLTNQAWTSPAPPAVCDTFWRGAYEALS